MKKILLYAASAVVVLNLVVLGKALGWQDTWPAQYRNKVTARVFGAPYDKVFDAAVRVSEDSGYPVVMSDREKGLIRSDYVSAQDKYRGKGQMAVNFFIQGIDEHSTKVRIDLRFQIIAELAGVSPTNGLVDEDDYEEFFDKLSAILQTGEKQDFGSPKY